jgi:hypothetical protein
LLSIPAIGWALFILARIGFSFNGNFDNSAIKILKKRFQVSFLVFGVLFTSGIVLKFMYFRKLRADLSSVCRNFNVQRSKVIINGDKLEHALVQVQALCDLESSEYHHSSPLKKISIDIINSFDSISVLLFRDSYNKSEYWVYINRSYLTRANEIGKIHSDAFDGF